MSGTFSRRALFARALGALPPDSPPLVGRRIAAIGADCLALRGIACASCTDPCEPRALLIRPMTGGRAMPVIDSQTCTGCGDCLKVCPAGALYLKSAAAQGEDCACA